MQIHEWRMNDMNTMNKSAFNLLEKYKHLDEQHLTNYLSGLFQNK